ncbi:hypothetical protein G9272_14965 [Streptomyces asoensis]|uniref:Ricin B lectin domain-containing protein n=1 Tax=Streptomyces asoensis TaxID=249586 RepID=A0A6M4WP24_9ACTN|nr:hypothetical protein [Streptomyces asoensis]QJT01461.1 hypothetical protein G9272_14965 [Streptomyces asoensis]
MAALTNGIYQISFTNEQLLTSVDARPGAPLMLLPQENGVHQGWKVTGKGGNAYTISLPDGLMHVSYDGDPDMHEPAILHLEPREWNLIPGEEPDTFQIAVVNAPMRLGLSLLRIYPPRVALAPEYGDRYQAWTFKNIG